MHRIVAAVTRTVSGGTTAEAASRAYSEEKRPLFGEGLDGPAHIVSYNPRHDTEGIARLALGSGLFLLDLGVVPDGAGHTPSTWGFLGSDIRRCFFGGLPFFCEDVEAADFSARSSNEQVRQRAQWKSRQRSSTNVFRRCSGAGRLKLCFEREDAVAPCVALFGS